MSDLLSSIIQLLLAIAGLSGIGGLFWGIFRYREGQSLKRKEILFELIREYDEPTAKMNDAKRLLDDYVLKPKPDWIKQNANYYHKTNFNRILRDHKDEGKGIEDKGELEIRESMDSLLEFFGKLGYLLKIGAVKKDEIIYFQYTLDKLKSDPYVKKYVQTYHFPLYDELLKQLDSKND